MHFFKKKKKIKIRRFDVKALLLKLENSTLKFQNLILKFRNLIYILYF